MLLLLRVLLSLVKEEERRFVEDLLCQALSEGLQLHRIGRGGRSCPGSELKGLASLSQLISLFLSASSVVSREEETS